MQPGDASRVKGVRGFGSQWRKSDALALYRKRKNEIRVGAKLPENVRRASIRFGQLAADIPAL